MARPTKNNVFGFIIALIFAAITIYIAFIVAAERLTIFDEFRAEVCHSFAGFRGAISREITQENIFSAKSWGYMLGRLLGGAQKLVQMVPIETICPIYQSALFYDTISFGRWVGKYGGFCWKMYDAGSKLKPLYASGNPALCGVTDYKFDGYNYELENDMNLPSSSYHGNNGMYWAHDETREIHDLFEKSVFDFALTEFLYTRVFYEQNLKGEEFVYEGSLEYVDGTEFKRIDCELKSENSDREKIELDKATCIPDYARFVRFECSREGTTGDCPGNKYNCGLVGRGQGCSGDEDYVILRDADSEAADCSDPDAYCYLITNNFNVDMLDDLETYQLSKSDITAAVELSHSDLEDFLSAIADEGTTFYLDNYAGARFMDKKGLSIIAPSDLYPSELKQDEFRTSPCSLLSGDFQLGLGDDDNADHVCWPWDDSSNVCDNTCKYLELTEGNLKLGYYDWTTHYEDADVLGLAPARWSDCSGGTIGSDESVPIISDYGLLALIYGDQPQIDKLMVCIVEREFGKDKQGRYFEDEEFDNPMWEGGLSCVLGLYDGDKNKDSSGNKPIYGYCSYYNKAEEGYGTCAGDDILPCQ